MSYFKKNNITNSLFFTVLEVMPTIKTMEYKTENNSFQDEFISKKILNILTENDEDELDDDYSYVDWIAKYNDISLYRIIDNPNMRSDVRGYCAKRLIEKSLESERDNLIAGLENKKDSLITFGILFGLEDIEDHDRILNYFLTHQNKRVRNSALHILAEKNKIIFLPEQTIN
jgi:hypothetical protein